MQSPCPSDRRLLFGSVVLLCLAAGTGRTAPCLAPAQPPDAPALPDLTQIKADLTELRSLEFKKEVPAEKQSIEDFEKYLQAELDKMFPPGKADDVQAALMRLGMLLKPIDLGHEFKNALLSQAGAYYDPASGKFFYLMTNVSEMILQTIASHELVHALQDQHFQLGPMMEKFEKEYLEGTRNDDRLLALRFLVEGEATYVQTLWQMKSMMGMDLAANPAMEKMSLKAMADMDFATIIQMSRGMAGEFAAAGDADDIVRAIEGMGDIPPYIMQPLLAAYLKGAYFVMSLRQEGGWDSVAKVYNSLPASTEQTLHPEKYLAQRDDPTPLSLPDLPYLEQEGWRLVDSAVHGEFYLELLLRNHGASAQAARRASVGWDGDIYRAWRHEDGRVLIALATTWDTEKDAREFFEAYRSIVPRKFRIDKPGGDEPGAPADRAEYQWGAAGLESGLTLLRGREVFIVEGAAPAMVKRIVDDAAAVKIEHVQ